MRKSLLKSMLFTFVLAICTLVPTISYAQTTINYTVDPTVCVNQTLINCQSIGISLFDPSTHTYSPQGGLWASIDGPSGPTNWLKFTGGLASLNDPTTGLVLVNINNIHATFETFTSKDGHTALLMDRLVIYFSGVDQNTGVKYAGQYTSNFDYTYVNSRYSRWTQSITGGGVRISTL
jgi:hypothetical protein